MKIKEIKGIKVYTFDQDGDTQHTFKNVTSNWAVNEQVPVLAIDFNVIGIDLEISVPISEIRRTLPPKP